MQIGNLHPLLVHLPIGMFILAFLLELYFLARPKAKNKELTLFVLGVGLLSAVVTAISGWFMGDKGGYDEVLLERHRWLAIAFAVTSLFLVFLKWSNNQIAKKAYFPSFVITIILLIITGHYGGSLTHGEGFLLEKSQEEVDIAVLDEANLYSEIVQPIIDDKCVSCHNPKKSKGDLVLSSIDGILSGGKSGRLFDSINLDESLLLQRIHLPLAEKKHMPPKGKPQLTEDEKLFIKWWIENQVCTDCKLKEISKNEAVEMALIGLQKKTSPIEKIRESVDEVSEEYINSLNQLGIAAQRIGENIPLLDVNLSHKTLNNEIFEFLEEHAENVVSLDLAYTNLDDKLAKALKPFKNLMSLELQNTAITSASLKVIEDFQYLESLNLFGTRVDDKAVVSLKNLPRLKSLYVWQTDLSQIGLLSIKEDNAGLLIQGKVADSVFAATKLAPPVILADSEIFKDSLLITMEQYIDGASIYYSLRNSENDTLPKPYTKPFYLNSSSKILAYTAMEGWENSQPSSSDFLKSNTPIASMELGIEPNPKYAGKKSLTLTDQKRGSNNFIDGNWLGFEGKSLTATIDLKNSNTISSITVCSLNNPPSWIFYPVGYTVWVSEDGNNFKEIQDIQLPKPDPNANTVEKQAYVINFTPTLARKVKLEVKNMGKNPDWHPNPGGDSWIFLDEIMVN